MARDTLCARQILLFVVKVLGNLGKSVFQTVPRIYQDFWTKQLFYKNAVFRE